MQEIDTLGQSKLHLFLIPLFFINCSDLSEYDSIQIKNALADSLLTTTESWNVDMNLIENGKLILNLQGSHSLTIRQSNKHETQIKGPVYIQVFKDDGNRESVITCDSALYKPDEAIFEMYGNVRVNTEDGKNLSSDFLKWEKNSDLVSTPNFVIFISPPDSIAANGFFGNTDLTNYTLNEGGGQVVID